ncbi:hypothetical protein Desac_2692 [Desulfobacca acetoxidans DSM 11109]|uniref:Uncharacterized protein n=1 Tax=Desulfobacca acetoxidans (strain ATCC 700848 / DSM 11109 / ASRB2) TaxID=880072 RepID=F2NIN2_DESAR|nr:hypothetical protein Desac_2692 [Desulfobacca acetoxidans DSM 11109]
MNLVFTPLRPPINGGVNLVFITLRLLNTGGTNLLFDTRAGEHKVRPYSGQWVFLFLKRRFIVGVNLVFTPLRPPINGGVNLVFITLRLLNTGGTNLLFDTRAGEHKVRPYSGQWVFLFLRRRFYCRGESCIHPPSAADQWWGESCIHPPTVAEHWGRRIFYSTPGRANTRFAPTADNGELEKHHSCVAISFCCITYYYCLLTRGAEGAALCRPADYFYILRH